MLCSLVVVGITPLLSIATTILESNEASKVSLYMEIRMEIQ